MKALVEGYIHIGKPFRGDEQGTARCLANRDPLPRTVIVATCPDLDSGDHYDARFWRAVEGVLVDQGLARSPEPGSVSASGGGEG